MRPAQREAKCPLLYGGGDTDDTGVEQRDLGERILRHSEHLILFTIKWWLVEKQQQEIQL